jgi:uncharacterized DUF497 family protein
MTSAQRDEIVGQSFNLGAESKPRRSRQPKADLGCVPLIVYKIKTKNDEETTRIISARRASRKERKRYEVEED